MTFDDISKRLLSFRHVSLHCGATGAEIDAASSALGLQICGSYRLFLSRFGWGGVEDLELHGLGSDVPKHLHLVTVTLSERVDVDPPLPSHLLPIMNNGGGDLVCLDTSVRQKEPTVVMWWHEDGPEQTPESVAPDFIAWLSEALDQRCD